MKRIKITKLQKTTALSITLVLTATLSLAAQEVRKEGPSVDFNKGRLLVSENGHYLEHENGDPFYYIGGTAWELFHRLNREEAEFYLENRRQKGFTVIQAVALAERNGLHDPNPYGELPLINDDPAKPNEKYWRHVDWVIRKAEEKGLYIGLLPTWGDKVDKQWGEGPVVFNKQNAFAYGKWIGERYKNCPNIIWINGGDRKCGGANKPVWDALAWGIKEADSLHLMTFHPMGGTKSSQCFHNSDWLDFNMLQSGHGDRFNDNYEQVVGDLHLRPSKPFLDGEPNYEDHPIRWKKEYGWFDDFDVRRACYYSVFAGGIGATYGAHPVWQMHKEGTTPVGDVRRTWEESLDLPGAWDMIHLRKLMELRPIFQALPDQSLIISGNNGSVGKIVALRAKDFLMFYLPANSYIHINTGILNTDSLSGSWYNPRTGQTYAIEEKHGNTSLKLDVPVRGIDWVLIIDKKGREVKHHDDYISFEISGDPRSLGCDCGNSLKITNFQNKTVETEFGKCLLAVQATTERSTLKISAKNQEGFILSEILEIVIE
jgi:hypothetical protein